MGAINQILPLMQILVNLCAPLRILLRKDNDWKWGKENEEAT